MSIFFTADTHFSHTNAIKYSNRPFSSVQEMDDILIRNWNALVSPKDLVYHLGDFAFVRSPREVIDIRKKLNGKIILITGNHDEITRKAYHHDNSIFEEVTPQKDIVLQTKKGKVYATLSHYAMRTWNKSHYGAIQLHGHSHNMLPVDKKYKSLDVGVDGWNFTPVSVSQILHYFENVFNEVTL